MLSLALVLQESVKPLVESKDPGVRKQRREIEQEVTVRLNQITSVQEQVSPVPASCLPCPATTSIRAVARTAICYVRAPQTSSSLLREIAASPFTCAEVACCLPLTLAPQRS